MDSSQLERVLTRVTKRKRRERFMNKDGKKPKKIKLPASVVVINAVAAAVILAICAVIFLIMLRSEAGGV